MGLSNEKEAAFECLIPESEFGTALLSVHCRALNSPYRGRRITQVFVEERLLKVGVTPGLAGIALEQGVCDATSLLAVIIALAFHGMWIVKGLGLLIRQSCLDQPILLLIS